MEFRWMSPEEIEQTKRFIVEKNAETAAILNRSNEKLDRALAEIAQALKRNGLPWPPG